ncbi:MAG: hypothetical protein ACRDE2_12335 [Chitinophagaceae bacterium]
MYSKIHHPLKAVALAALLFFMVISCKQSKGGTNKTPMATTIPTSNNINPMAQNRVSDPKDTTPPTIAIEPPPPPPPSPTPYSRGSLDSIETKDMAMSMKAWHISGVKATVVNNIVTLTGNTSKKDLRTIMIVANQYKPAKVINKMIVK